MSTYDSILKVIMALGGLGLFLIGMKNMGEGLELAAGNKLRVLLQKITSNKFIAMLVGVLVTGVIQSSSATDAMVVGFANAGLMELGQAIGILFGAKIGTTVTSLLMATDPYLSPRKQLVKSSEKKGLFLAMDIADIWLERALAGK